MDASTDRLASAISAFLDDVTDSGTVRLASLAWLVAVGLRRTACCGASHAIAAVNKVFDPVVEFEGRPPEAWPGVPFDLGDAVVLYAAGSRAELEAVWAEHRVRYTQGTALGRALGYFAPRERFSETDARLLHVRHYVEGPAGTQVELWHETVPVDTDPAALADYTARFDKAFAAVGRKYTVSVEK